METIERAQGTHNLSMGGASAGWIECWRCKGSKRMVYAGSPYPCDTCDGIGMTVGPPADGIYIVGRAGADAQKRNPRMRRALVLQLAKRANAYSGGR